MKQKTIGIDARFYGHAGPGRYTKSVIQHLEKVDKVNKYKVFVTDEGNKLYEPSNPNFEKVLANHTWYSFDEQIFFLFKVLKAGLDLYYVPHFNIPVLYPGKIVTAIPDMIMHTYSTAKGTTLPQWYFQIKRIVYRWVFWWAVLRSQKVIVPTQTVKNEFLKHLKGFSEDKYVIAPEGVDPEFIETSENPKDVLSRYGIKQPYLLHVGSMYEHKNIDGIIKAHKILGNKYGFKGQLVLVSKKDEFSKRIYDSIRKEGLEDKIVLPAFIKETNDESKIVITDDEVVALRKEAFAYVFGAFKEGFSLTALEGMALGLPAALSDIDCHREVYGDSVLYFDPHNVEDIAEKINKFISSDSLKEEYIARGYKQIEKYSWNNTAEITLDVFKKALKQN
jgi:glycosyltransferase involved in cell wall biosynthesis